MNLEDRIHSLRELQEYSYRVLQKIAKGMSLPSNFKKVYLIHLIHTKQFGTAEEVNNIVQKAKLERLQLSQNKKKTRSKSFLQGSEISSTSNSHSPPITNTPKRHVVLNRSPGHQTVMKYSRPQNILQPKIIRKTYPSPKKSSRCDRILRSFNIVKKTNYANVNSSLFDVIKAQNSSDPRQRSMKFNGENNIHNPKWNVTTNSIMKKQNQSILKPNNIIYRNNDKRCQYPTSTSTTNCTSVVPAKRQRLLSGIYPITPKKDGPKSNSYIQSIGFRHSDGKISKINALVQKSKTPLKTILNKPQSSGRNFEVTVQDLIDCNIDSQSNTNSICSSTETNVPNSQLYPNMSSLNDVIGKHMCYLDGQKGCVDNNELDNQYSAYCHKKIRGEQVRSQRSFQREVPSQVANEKLPRINEVFTKFNDVHSDVTQPIYVQVSEESERLRNYPIYVTKNNPTNTNLLETLYNFKNQFVVHQPLLQVATTSNTTCTYSTALVASAYAHQSTLATNEPFTEPYTASSCERDSMTSTEMEEGLSDLLKFAEQDNNVRSSYDNEDELSTTSSSLVKTSSQELGASVTIPEMVEDALEIISQDGDYMERIGMDVRTQCILCSWAGPKFILEYHIRQEHARDIGMIPRGGWRGRLHPSGGAGSSDNAGKETVHRLLQREDVLYVLAATRRAGCLVASLCIVSTETDLPKTGNITIYNKTTGEPYSWEGEIQEIPDDITNEDDTNCLKLELSRLGLSPNSCSKNKEMTIESPTSTTVDTELDGTHVVLYVEIFN